MHTRRSHTLALLLAASSLRLAGQDPAFAQACSSSTSFTYTFTNYCQQPIFVGQNGPGPSVPPSSPESGNWALAPACTNNNQCGSKQTCNQGKGQCTCGTDSDCPGSAPCISGFCSTTATFCIPQSWSSGVFWPRTGCTLAGTAPNQTLTCTTGQCGGTPGVSGGQVDCGGGAGQLGPAPPATLFEPTSSSASTNYDVSLNSGYNVGISAVPVGGGYVYPLTTTPVACSTVGCIADLSSTCPTYLQTSGGGCLDPCDQCQRSAPGGSSPNATIYATLMCNQPITKDYLGNKPAPTVLCNGTPSKTGPTYQDMYCVKNVEGDSQSQASINQGTPVAFPGNDCPVGTSFVIPTFPSGFAPPTKQGVCLYMEALTPNPNNYGWADAKTGKTLNCGSLADGTGCGGYLTKQSDGGYFPTALGYTCRTVTYTASGATQTAHLCLPPITSGLGTCATDSGGSLSLYAGPGGPFNASWLTAGLQAATASTSPPYNPGTTAYYATFKNACPTAYTYQYDDAASGFACTAALTVPPNGTFTGFNVAFCPPAAAQPSRKPR